jgi:ABC-2 type transport system permease protein
MMKAYLYSLKMSLSSSLSLRESFLLQAVFMLGSNLCLFSFWWLFFNHFKTIGVWGIKEMACLYGLVSGSYGLFSLFFGGGKVLPRLISEGDLDATLTKPKSTLLLLLSSKSIPSGWGDLLSAMFFFVYSGKIGLQNLPLLLLLLLSSTLVFVSFSILLGSITFWVGEGRGLAKMLFDFLLTFSNYPKTIYTGGVRFALFTLIPSGLIGAMPVELLFDFSWKGLLLLLSSSLVYLSIASKLFHIGLKRYLSGNRIGFRI